MARAPRATVTINTGNGWFAFKRIINKKILFDYISIYAYFDSLRREGKIHKIRVKLTR